jgi:hypothetical protein
MSRKHDAPEYKCWASMIQRCQNPALENYQYYGGRGIKVCERWRKFENFLADMGPRPGSGHTLDRYPNKDGNYEPGNCRWATRAQQHENMRPRFGGVTFQGRTQSVTAWAREVGISQQSLGDRLKRGWPLDVALSLRRLANHERMKHVVRGA